jgi:hypothetical protein
MSDKKSFLASIYYAILKLKNRILKIDNSIKNFPARKKFHHYKADNHIVCSFCSFEFSYIRDELSLYWGKSPEFKEPSHIKDTNAQQWFYNYYPSVECPKCLKKLESCYTVRVNNCVVTLLF